eukprot:TRINITY_DN121063_c0_g1_i1.p1 TRINITY_DN121063_c0_g1~~TRINITY_DN121063_c0_g1_i1.p1  ORF type:complete len:539 (-),score=171.77 TRINITY_DN121063_c0_g1_i1:252-1868(-)
MSAATLSRPGSSPSIHIEHRTLPVTVAGGSTASRSRGGGALSRTPLAAWQAPELETASVSCFLRPNLSRSTSSTRIAVAGNRRRRQQPVAGGSFQAVVKPTPSKAQQKSSSAAELRAKAEVHELDKDMYDDENRATKGPWPDENLLSRLKSRNCRIEALNHKDFLNDYMHRAVCVARRHEQEQLDQQLNGIIRASSRRAEELRQDIDSNRADVLAAQHLVKHLSDAESKARTAEVDMANLSVFERSQKQIKENKIMEAIGEKKAEAQNGLLKLQRTLESSLIEFRDCRVLLQEYKRIRLGKLCDVLNSCTVNDGSLLRSCIKEMIRNGAQRITMKVQQMGPSQLEGWMREALVNLCHIEIQIADGEERLTELRARALDPGQKALTAMAGLTERQRFDHLCMKTLDCAQNLRAGVHFNMPWLSPSGTGDEAPMVSSSLPNSADETVLQTLKLPPQMEINAKEEMQKLEAEVTGLRNMLEDLRENVAAIICNRMRQAQKNRTCAGGDFWKVVLSSMVSEDFSKKFWKEVAKNEAGGTLRE